MKKISYVALLLPSLAMAEDWSHYGGGQHGMQYSSLSQIDASNVDNLEEVWRYRSGELGEGHAEPFAFQANPILVEGLLYLSTGSAIVIALNPVTGEEVWRHDPEINRSVRHSEISNRGVSSWIDDEAGADALCRHRIFVGTLDARLIAVDGKTGELCAEFGQNGNVDLGKVADVDRNKTIDYLVTSPPAIVDDVVIVGSAIGDNNSVESSPGIVRGIDARSGEERWRWDPVPRDPDNAAYSDWLPDEVAVTGSANAWAPLAADPELGLVYVPTGSASPDFYGGERQGDNRYANSVVALHANSGEVAWHQQLVHHDVWDYDVAAQPTLVDLEHRGERVPALLQGTKTGLIFSFDRRNGEPIFDIEERAVPQGGVEGEHLSPTQPFPVAPPPLVRHEPVTADDAWGMLVFDKRACARKFASLRSEGIFTPPSLQGTIVQPGYAGGINWGGVAFDESRQLAYAFVMNLAAEVALIPRADVQMARESEEFSAYEIARQRGTPYGMRRRMLLSPLSVPCIKPPWGKLVAVDMRKGEIAWERKVGSIQDVAPAFVPNFQYGVPGAGGPIVTAGGVLFLAATMDNYLRAFDSETGAMLWEGRLPAGGQATPMTYFVEDADKQFVVIAAGGHSRMGTTTGDYVIAFALDD